MTAARTVACYFYDPVKVPLLRDGMLPALHDARANGLRAHVERHWLHGPHLSLHLRGARTEVDAAAECAARSLRGALRRVPSRSTATPEQLLAASELAGRAELVPGPYQPIHPDNSVLVSTPADDSISELIGGPAALACRALLLEHAVPVLDSLGDTSTSTRRVAIALTAMAAHAASYPLGRAGGYLSFLSHVEDFLFLNDQDGAVREKFNSVYEQRRAAVLTRVGERGGAWRDWSEHAQLLCAAAYRRGEFELLPGDGYAGRARAVDPDSAWRWGPDRAEFSDFHRALDGIDFIDDVHESFGPYRFATNVLYQLLVLCDVTPIERYLAGHLLARAVQELRGRTWQQDLAAATTGGT